MHIARVSSATRGEVDRLLTALATELQQARVRLVGAVKDQSHESRFANGCDMRLRVLPDGPLIPITQNLGAGSDACRLDPAGIAEAVAQVEQGPIDGADLFILNKFGPEELAGRGFVSAIGRAVGAGVPVLIGVGMNSHAAFDAFAGGAAVELPPDASALRDWCQKAIGAKQACET